MLMGFLSNESFQPGGTLKQSSPLKKANFLNDSLTTWTPQPGHYLRFFDVILSVI